MNSFFRILFLIYSLLLTNIVTSDRDKHNLSESALENFRKALCIQSICWSKGNYNETALILLKRLIMQSYPLLHNNKQVTFEIINNYSLFYTIKAKKQVDSERELPFMFLAHLDVVPVDDQNWTYPPFNASIHQDYIYARGTLDNKHNAFAILEALEEFIKEGSEFKRDFFIFFGHDEECLGLEGAKALAEKLKGQKLDWVLDEGMMVVKDLYPFVSPPIAHVAVAEKGYMTLKLEVNLDGGHSSFPPKETTITLLARAVERLTNNPPQSMLGRGLEFEALKQISAQSSILVSWLYSLLSSSLWLISWFIPSDPVVNALTRTTTIVTMFHAGVKENVIPTTASAIVNHRVHPQQTCQEILDFDKKVIADDRINISIISASPPVQASCFDSSPSSCNGFFAIEKTIMDVWEKDCIVVPALLTGTTDSRHFINVSKAIYRFSPVQLTIEDTRRIHGNNERISLHEYSRMISFYKKLLQNLFHADKRFARHLHDSL